MQTHDLTTGGVTKTLVRFTMPFLLASLLQTLYGIVDLIVVGNFTGAAEIAAVSVGSLIMGTLNMFIIGLTAGGTVLIGQLLGAGRKKDMDGTIATMFTLYAAITVALIVILMLCARPILVLMRTPGESFDATLGYVRICIAGMIFTAGYNSIAAVLRGMGDSKHPLLFVFVACIANIIGDIILVGPLGMGAEGAAIATSAAQAVSMAAGIIYLKRHNFSFDFKPRSFRITRDKVAPLLRLGIPISLQEVLVMSSFILLQAIINDMGYIAVAAAGVADKVFMIAVIPATAFSQSIAAMVAQNVGADKPGRVRQSLKAGLIISFAIGVALFAFAQLLPQVFVRAFTSDEAVINNACSYLRSYSYDYLLCSLVFCMNGFINGCGRTRFTLINNIVSTFVVRVPLVFAVVLLVPGATLFHIGIALPVASLVQGIGATGFIMSGKWRDSKVI